MQQTDKWMNDEKVGAGYNGRYRKYIDVDKKWFDVLKSLHSDILEEDIPYAYNEDGTINRNETAEAMKRMSRESVSAEKIQNALRASLSPDEMEQLNIDGRYQFRNINDPVEIANYSKTRFNSLISQNEKAIKELEGRKELASSDPNTLLKIDEGVKSLQQLNKNLVDEMNTEIDMLGKDIESAKGYIYRRGAIEQFASAHAWEKQKSNLLTNPINAYRMDVAKHQLNIAEFEQRKIQFDWSKTMDIKKFELAQAEAMMKNTGMLSDDSSIYLGTSTQVQNQQGALLKEINNNNEEYNSTVNRILKNLPNVTRDQLENAIELYDKGDTKEFKDIVPVQYRDAIGQALKSKQKAKSLEIYKEQVRKDVESSSPLIAEHNAKLDELSKSMKPITVDGITFSPQEVRNYLNKTKRVDRTSVDNGILTVRTEYEPIAPLTEKEELLRQRRYDVALNNRAYVSTLNEYQDVVNEAIEKQMMEDNGVFLPSMKPILLSTEQGNRARNKMENLTSAFLGKYAEGKIQKMKGGAEVLSPEEVQIGLSWMGESDRSAIQYRLVSQGDANYLSVQKGAEEVLIPITPDEVRMLPVQYNVTETQAYKSLISRQQMFKGNTNPTGNFAESYFDRTDMPNVTFNVRADLTQQYGDPNRQYVTLRVMTPKGVIPYQYPEQLDATRAMTFISNLTDQDVKQLYLRSNINPEWKKLIEDL